MIDEYKIKKVLNDLRINSMEKKYKCITESEK